MTGSRRNARLGLDFGELLQGEALQEVGPGAVIGHHAGSGEQPHSSNELLGERTQLPLQFLRAFIEQRSVLRVGPGQGSRDRAPDRDAVEGIEHVVRIAVDMDIAQRSRQLGTGWNLEQLDSPRGVDVPFASGEQPLASRAAQKVWHPWLRVESQVHEEIGLAELHDKARLRDHIVGVLRSTHQALDPDLLSTDLSGQVSKRGVGCDHPNIGERIRRQGDQQRKLHNPACCPKKQGDPRRRSSLSHRFTQ